MVWGGDMRLLRSKIGEIGWRIERRTKIIEK